MSKRKTRHFIAGRINGVALVINTSTMKYLWCHNNAMESVACLDKGNPAYGCAVDNLETLKGYIKTEGNRILI